MSSIRQRNFFGRGAGRTHFMLNVAVAAANWQMPVLVVMLDAPACARAKRTLEKISARRAIAPATTTKFITVIDVEQWRSGFVRGLDFKFEYLDHAVDEALGGDGLTFTERERMAHWLRALDKARGGEATLADAVRELESGGVR